MRTFTTQHNWESTSDWWDRVLTESQQNHLIDLVMEDDDPASFPFPETLWRESMKRAIAQLRADIAAD